MRMPQDIPRRFPATSRGVRIGILAAVVAVIVLVVVFRWLATFWTSYLWYQSVHFTSVFRGVLLNEVVISLIFIAALIALLLFNLTAADRMAPAIPPGPEDEFTSRYRAVVGNKQRWVRLVAAVLFGFIGGVEARGQWNDWVLFLHRVNFTGQASTDPINHINAGFYVFQLPFLEYFVNWLFNAFVLATILTVVAHYLNGGINPLSSTQRVSHKVKVHVSVLLAILALIKAGDYYLERLSLVLSHKYTVNGATYTVVHAERPALIILMVAAVFAMGLFLYNIRQRGWLLPGVAVGVWIVVYLLVAVAYPAFIQGVRVNPSALTREGPYLNDNINATRQAIGINTVTTSRQPVSDQTELNASDVTGSSTTASANEKVINNIPLLDPNYVSSVFSKDQALRQYFQFPALNVDRYDLNGQLTQVLLSVRELNEGGVPGGFVNQKLAYTHGYGAAVAPANQDGVNETGALNFNLSGLPPATDPGSEALSLTQPSGTAQPRVYFGEGASEQGFVIASSRQAEQDYQNAGGQEQQWRYDGNGGVKAGSLIRRSAFALRFGNLDFLLSGQITANSQVLYYRNVVQRAEKAAPFLRFDADPYPVIANGQIDWVLDAYTASNQFPFAQQDDASRLNGGSHTLAGAPFNYARNSVKVVINAYTGQMKFFVVDPTDPIVKSYSKAFPDLFTPVSQAPKDFPGVQNHWRYPQDLFTVQSNMYGRYHLTNVSQFYTQNNAWNVAQNPGSGVPGKQTSVGVSALAPNGQVINPSVPRFNPVYVLTHLPGDTQLPFLIEEPFVASSSQDQQQNLTGLLTASDNADGQGSLQSFTTPPNQNVAGPALAGSQIKNNTTVSSEITLLNTQGSTVQLGNLVPILLGNTLMYVEPLYVESSENSVPALRDVIVIYKGAAYDSGNASIDNALCKITNADNTQPFASYCGTNEANRPVINLNGSTPNGGKGGQGGKPAPSGGSGSGAAPSTSAPAPSTSAPSSSTPVPPPPANATVQQLVQAAESAYNAGQTALKSGDLAAYQSDMNQVNTYLQQISALQGGGTTPPAGAAGSGAGAAPGGGSAPGAGSAPGSRPGKPAPGNPNSPPTTKKG